MPRRRLVFVNRYFHPDHSATSQMLSDLAFHLASRGWDTTVVTSRQRYDDATAGLAAREDVRGVHVRRIWSSRFGRTFLPGRALDYLTFYAAAFLELLRILRRGDIVVALTDPPMVSVIAAAAAIPRRARLVNWLHDLFPEVAEALGVRGLRLTRVVRDWSLRRAVANVALSETMAQHVRRAGAAAVVRHNWADAAIAPVSHEQSRLRAQLGAGRKTIVAYSGNLGRAHDSETIARSLDTAPAAGTEVWFIGGGAGMRELQKELGSRPYLRFLDYQPRESLSDSLSAADVHLVSLLPSAEGFIVPSKIYGVLSVGRPTIFVGDADGEVARLIRGADAGLIVPSGDSDSLREAISQLASDPELRARLGANALAIHHREYSAARALGEWERIIEQAAS